MEKSKRQTVQIDEPRQRYLQEDQALQLFQGLPLLHPHPDREETFDGMKHVHAEAPRLFINGHHCTKY